MDRRERILVVPQSILCTEIERYERVTMRDILSVALPGHKTWEIFVTLRDKPSKWGSSAFHVAHFLANTRMSHHSITWEENRML